MEIRHNPEDKGNRSLENEPNKRVETFGIGGKLDLVPVDFSMAFSINRLSLQ